MIHRFTYLLKAFVTDKNGHVVLAQWPNLPLFVALGASAAGWLLKARALHYAQLVSDSALIVWALLEVFKGVNYFRRALGLGVFIVVVLGLIRGA